MKAFWDNLFYDMREQGLTEEKAAEEVVKDIRDDFDNIEKAILNLDLKKALALIEEYKEYYYPLY